VLIDRSPEQKRLAAQRHGHLVEPYCPPYAPRPPQESSEPGASALAVPWFAAKPHRGPQYGCVIDERMGKAITFANQDWRFTVIAAPDAALP
jgi:hypothetical protein